MRWFFLLCVLIFIFYLGIYWFPRPTYQVIEVIDGDTIVVLFSNKEKCRVRLVGIDAPEKSQPQGMRSKEELSQRILGKSINLDWKQKDRYGRILGNVYYDGRYINQEMVEDGWAWCYTEYCRSLEIVESQKRAKEKKLGLWKDNNPIPPWKFRKK